MDGLTETQTTVYRTLDGREFTDRTKAEAHLKAIKLRAERTSYWIVHHSPDLTEGRGMQAATILQVYIHQGSYIPAYEWVLDYCVRTWGRKISYVQGVAPTPNWVMTQLDDMDHALRIFKNGKNSSGIRPSSIKWHYLAIGDREKGLEIVHENLEDPPYVPANPAG